MLLACSIVFGAALLGGICCSLERRDVWSISIYRGADPLSLLPHPEVVRHPVLTAADVTDVKAEFVADPFIVRQGADWHMFFETLVSSSRRGVISLAVSADGQRWRYDSVVLREPFHLSYPYVFAWKGEWYMVPESAEARAVYLYRAVEFPRRWQRVAELLSGRYYDASLLRHADRWWLFAFEAGASLTLHHAEALEGPWQIHPRSPVVKGDIRTARPAGRLITHEGSIIRYAQDGYPRYGSSVRAFRVDELSAQSYREHEVPGGPVAAGSGKGWNAAGMHHIDPQRLDAGSWVACVDGNRQRWVLNWRYGVRRALNRIM
jgi:hypothetical protein